MTIQGNGGIEASQIYNGATSYLKNKGYKVVEGSERRVDVDGNGDNEIVRQYKNTDGQIMDMIIDENDESLGYQIELKQNDKLVLELSSGKNQEDMKVSINGPTKEKKLSFGSKRETAIAFVDLNTTNLMNQVDNIFKNQSFTSIQKVIDSSKSIHPSFKFNH